MYYFTYIYISIFSYSCYSLIKNPFISWLKPFTCLNQIIPTKIFLNTQKNINIERESLWNDFSNYKSNITTLLSYLQKGLEEVEPTPVALEYDYVTNDSLPELEYKTLLRKFNSCGRYHWFNYNLEYDYLSSNSLNTINIQQFSARKGNRYLLSWFLNCKKWGILSGELVHLDREVEKYFKRKSHRDLTAEDDSIDVTDYDYEDDDDPYDVASNTFVEKYYRVCNHSSGANDTNIVETESSVSGYDRNTHKGIADYIVSMLKTICSQYEARVICIGDVHGCLYELQDLLRKVEYKPSDAVILLGDMVAKGYDSPSVVRLAREIKALSVRGNHDFEVIRAAIHAQEEKKMHKKFKRSRRLKQSPVKGTQTSTKSDSNKSFNNEALESNDNSANSYDQGSNDKRIASKEHTSIALSLNAEDVDWMSKLPYFIYSPDLGALFVHAGFNSQIPLAMQPTWVLMTTRSLYDGRLSPRCYRDFPWAKEWKGPMTVYFGHDAARGLQVYEHAMGIDTGCVYGGELTAVILPSKEIVSVPAHRAYQNPKKSSSYRYFHSTSDTNTTEEVKKTINPMNKFVATLGPSATEKLMKIRRRKLTLSSTRRQQIDDETINNIVSEEQKAALIDMVQAAIVEEMLEMHQYNISIIVDELFQYYLQKTNENEYKNNDGNDIVNDHETNQKMIAVAQSMLNEDDIAYGDGIDNFMGDL